MPAPHGSTWLHVQPPPAPVVAMLPPAPAPPVPPAPAPPVPVVAAPPPVPVVAAPPVPVAAPPVPVAVAPPVPPPAPPPVPLLALDCDPELEVAPLAAPAAALWLASSPEHAT